MVSPSSLFKLFINFPADLSLNLAHSYSIALMSSLYEMVNSPKIQNNLVLIASPTEIKSVMHMLDVCIYFLDKCMNE